MRVFSCQCGSRIFFDNSQCLTCGRELGFLPDASLLVALDEAGSFSPKNGGSYRKCSNYAHQGVCNWMVPAAAEPALCQACELNHVIPDLSQPENKALWFEVEKAKRRLVYSLNRLGLPVVPKTKDAERGLSFDIKASVGQEHVLTGHSDGLITLNLAEADPSEREKVRQAMNERYRTVLGHFRHEIGHYYWDRLVDGTPALERFRALFGDERSDYGASLQQHYERPKPLEPDPKFISHYAAAHPWEDFAETFAHYLHMVDTLETARQFGFASAAVTDGKVFDPLLAEWMDLTIALNALNRSMGLPDAYPFAISAEVTEKLRFVHELIVGGRAGAQRQSSVA